MRVHLRFLRDADIGRDALVRGGWHLERDVDDSVWAMHPRVMDESAARLHLHNVGLLTACSVSIEFVKRATGERARRWGYRSLDSTATASRARHLGLAD